MSKTYYLYILTNFTNNVLYTGVTNNLYRRLEEHELKIHPYSFTAKYNVNKLVYFEVYTYIYDAIYREKQIKAGSRRTKIMLIESLNPDWKDLRYEIVY